MSRGEQPAYPVPKDTWAEGYPPGITIREHYAGLALQAVIAALVKDENMAAVGMAAERKGITVKLQIAHVAFEYADAMIAAGEHKP